MSIWQTKSWSDMLVASGQADEVFEVSGVWCQKRRISFGKYGLFVMGIAEDQFHEELAQALQDAGKGEECVFVQVETLDYIGSGEVLQVGKYFQEGVYKKFIMPYTALIDLQKSKEEILSHMKPKGRYNIRLSEKKGVVVEEVEGNDETISTFFRLMQETTTRDHFSGNTKEYYLRFMEQVPGAKLYFAKYGDEIISAGIFVFFEDTAIYYYGASTSSGAYRNLMAPYALQWKAIQDAQASGIRWYDFLGVATPGDSISHLAGVTDFKRKLTPDIRQVSTGYIWVNQSFRYYIIQLLRKWRL